MSDDEQPHVRRSSRARGQNVSRNAVLEELKASRQTGRVHRANLEEYDADLYRYVDEDEEIDDNDFVVDDGTGTRGYVEGDDEEEELEKVQKIKEERKKFKESISRKGDIRKFCKVAPEKPKQTAVDDTAGQEMLNELLAFVDASDGADLIGMVKQETAENEPPSPRMVSGFKRAAGGVDLYPKPAKLIKRAPAQQKVIPKQSKTFVKSEPDAVLEEDSDAMDFDAAEPINFEPLPLTKQPSFSDDVDFISPPDLPAPELETTEEKPARFAASTNTNDLSTIGEFQDVLAEEEEQAATAVSNGYKLEEYLVEHPKHDKALRFYWMDAFEDSKHSDRVYLFGFVKTSSTDFESCTVVVENIQHRLFFLKRDTHAKTGEAVTALMLYDEVRDLLCSRFSVSTFRCTNSRRKFAYMDGVTPLEADCLEVYYNASLPIPAAGIFNGNTFSRVCNATVSAMERLLVERGIKGPCWLEIAGVTEVAHEKQVCFTAKEFRADMVSTSLSQVNVMPDLVNEPAPPCKMLAFNIVTVANPKTNKPEIVLISMIKYSKFHLDRQTPGACDSRTTFICAPSGSTIPFSLKKDAEHRKMEVSIFPNEKALLSNFLGSIKLFDPDVLISHDLTSQLATLRERLEHLKLVSSVWAFLGRLKRPENLKSLPQNKYFRWLFTTGRLCLDSKAIAMELVHSNSYDLEELVAKILSPVDPSARRRTVDNDQILAVFRDFSGKTEPFFNLMTWSLFEAHFSRQIIAQLSAMPLFLQMTQIVGGVLSRTLMGGRAERNEYLLLHAFSKSGYIAPDRLQHVNRKATIKIKGEIKEEGEAEGVVAPTNSKKAQYTGGLVLEPKRGLYETFIVLLDFNSLYPSIIREFNICFTTIKLEQRSKANEEDLPPVPDSSCAEGILPHEIAGLVNSRREVKKVMKQCVDKKSEQYKQYDIRQLGLKLTANSMYGCLGFEGSRFCAKTLAAMVTAKGREILEATRNLVESNGYTVIYGDTDSIMVNTNSTDLMEAKKIGNDIKQLINRSYRCLTLDIDGVYKRLLLLRKKKYAGLSIDLSNESRTSRELKGLDIVRRDWSGLAKEIGEKVVDIILSSNQRDEMVDEIRQELETVKAKLDDGSIPLEKFEILKKLTHRPEEYKDASSQPHVQVALRLNATKNANLRQNDVVKYIICEDGTSNPNTQRAYARIEVEGSEELNIDSHYYLAQQIHPVVSRLCEPIEEMDACQVATALGLDASGYRRKLRDRVDANNDDDDNMEPGVLHDFNVCDGLPITCPKCEAVFVTRSPLNSDGELALSKCNKCKFDFLSDPISIELQLVEALGSAQKKFNSAKYVCDDAICGFELPFKPVFKNQFGYPCTDCNNGFFRSSYSQKRFYDQQCFLATIVDLHAFMNKEATAEQKRTIQTHPKYDELMTCHAIWTQRVKRAMDRNTYAQVDLTAIFAPMRVA